MLPPAGDEERTLPDARRAQHGPRTAAGRARCAAARRTHGFYSAETVDCGAAARWAPGSSDPDVFVESIGYAETREYVKSIYQYHATYRALTLTSD